MSNNYKILELWCILGDLESTEFISQFEIIKSAGHIGFCFDNLPIKNKKKKIYGFNPIINLPIDFDNIFYNINPGTITDDTIIFKKFIRDKYPVYLINTYINKGIYDEFKDILPNNYPLVKYGIKSWCGNKNVENCLTYIIKYLKPYIFDDNDKIIFINDYNGFLSTFIRIINNKYNKNIRIYDDSDNCVIL